IALPLSGLVVTRLGESRTVAVMSLVSAAGLGAVALGHSHGIPGVAVGLAVFGFGSATWDVAMNVQGAAVERALRRAVMPKYHAGWSLGPVAGAAAGAAMVVLGVPVTAALLSVAAALVVTVPATTRYFLPDSPGQADLEPAARRSPLVG